LLIDSGNKANLEFDELNWDTEKVNWPSKSRLQRMRRAMGRSRRVLRIPSKGRWNDDEKREEEEELKWVLRRGYVFSQVWEGAVVRLLLEGGGRGWNGVRRCCRGVVVVLSTAWQRKSDE
jgi:hypothetical protein